MFDDYFRKEHAAGHECVTYVKDERLLGFDRGHAELLASIDAWLTSLEKGQK